MTCTSDRLYGGLSAADYQLTEQLIRDNESWTFKHDSYGADQLFQSF